MFETTCKLRGHIPDLHLFVIPKGTKANTLVFPGVNAVFGRTYYGARVICKRCGKLLDSQEQEEINPAEYKISETIVANKNEKIEPPDPEIKLVPNGTTPVLFGLFADNQRIGTLYFGSQNNVSDPSFINISFDPTFWMSTYLIEEVKVAGNTCYILLHRGI